VAALYIWYEKDAGDNHVPAPLLGDYNLFVNIAFENLGRDAQVVAML
jgi:hypothetical protein